MRGDVSPIQRARRQLRFMGLQQIPNQAVGAIEADVPAAEQHPGRDPLVIRGTGRLHHGNPEDAVSGVHPKEKHFDLARSRTIGKKGLGIGGCYWQVILGQRVRVI